MFNELLEVTREFLKKVITSRLFALAVIFTLMFIGLICKLFRMQILDGSSYQESYMQRTEKLVTTPGTRGNIYDRNGNLLAYNQLAYAVAIQDLGDYPKAADRNAMIYRLVTILERRGEKIDGKLEIALDENGQPYFTSTSNAAKKRFLLNFYGISSQQLDDDTGKYPSNITAREAFELKKGSSRQGYKLADMKDADGNPMELSDQTALDMINIIYTMELTRFQKYESTTVATNISQETMTEINENAADLKGVSIEPSSIRVYNDSLYFAPIIGYTGKVQEDQIDSLNEEWNSSKEGQKSDAVNGVDKYDLNDIVGRIGIEKSMELDLQGEKGYTRMYVDNMGRPREIIEQQDAQAGNDVYLTIDRDLQIATYNLIEQQLAGIITKFLVNEDIDPATVRDGSKKPIPVKNAYYQLINNNVLSLDAMAGENASDIEKQIYRTYTASRDQILTAIRGELLSDHAAAMNDLPKDMASYMNYIYSFLSSDNSGIVQRDKIDQNSQEYQAWKAGTISLRDYIYSGIAGNWVDTTRLAASSKYSNADDIYSQLVDYIIAQLQDDKNFTKRMFRYLVNDNVITGSQLCLALFAQGVLRDDPQARAGLATGDSAYTYNFIKNKIADLELTPAQLALDPCTAGCVVTDVKTGELLALVSYPGYDNNRLANTVDADYFASLNTDLSKPLYNYATQERTAPGSTFKMVSSVAGLASGVITPTTQIMDKGVYENISNHPRCWALNHGYTHGLINVSEALRDSCNYFFYDVGYRLATNNFTTSYDDATGISKITEYASLLGLDETTGVEIEENDPQIANEYPVMAAIGQSNNNYATIQLGRYVSAIANDGNVYEYTLLSKVCDSDGNTLETIEPKVRNTVDVLDTTQWNAIHTGMRMVVENLSTFDNFPIEVAGKTGTAQQSPNRPNHALFVGYAPYNDPEVSIATRIAFGYTSHNAAEYAKNVFSYYFGVQNAEDLLNGQAENVGESSNSFND